jgi:hypothetical protein
MISVPWPPRLSFVVVCMCVYLRPLSTRELLYTLDTHGWMHGCFLNTTNDMYWRLGRVVGSLLPLRAHALTLPTIRFALRSMQTHISKQFRIEMRVCTLLKANLIGGRVRADALKDKINFTLDLWSLVLFYICTIEWVALCTLIRSTWWIHRNNKVTYKTLIKTTQLCKSKQHFHKSKQTFHKSKQPFGKSKQTFRTRSRIGLVSNILR